MSKELDLSEREHLGRALQDLTMYTYEAKQKFFNKVCKTYGRAFIERLLADVFHNSPNWGRYGKATRRWAATHGSGARSDNKSLVQFISYYLDTAGAALIIRSCCLGKGGAK